MDRKVAAVVFVTIFFDLMGFGILIPVQPFFALSFQAPPSVITLLSASYSFMQFIFMAVWGRMSDRFGRRPVMLISIATSALGFFIFAHADSIMMLFASRMIAGLGGANISAAQAIMADISSPQERAKGMGLVASAMGLGFIFGPILGGILGQNGFMMPALVSGILSLLNLGLTFLFLKETRLLNRQETTQGGTIKEHSLRRAQGLRPLFVLSFLLIMMFALFEQSIGIYLNSEFVGNANALFDQSVKFTAIYLATVASISALIQIVALKALTHRFGEERLLVHGFLVCGFALVTLPLVGFAQHFLLLMIPGALFAAGLGICMPCLSSLVSQTAKPGEQGLALGRSQSFFALGRVIGPAICGLLFEYSHHMPFFVAGMIGFICFVIAVLTIKTSATRHWRNKDDFIVVRQ